MSLGHAVLCTCYQWETQVSCQAHLPESRHREPSQHEAEAPPPPDHPQMIRVREWFQLQIVRGRYNGQLVANFDQIWSLCYSPSKQTLVQKPKASDDLARKISLRRVRHCIERVLGKEYTENMDDSTVAVPEGNTAKIQGGVASYSPVDGYRIPRTLTSLSWADGTLGRGYVCCRSDCITEQQRAEANKDYIL